VARHGYADTLFVNGKVVSMDDASTSTNVGNIYQAVAIKGAKIVKLGTNAAVRTLAGPDTKVFDLKGRTDPPPRTSPPSKLDLGPLPCPGKIGLLDPETSEIEIFPTPTENSGVRRLRFDPKGRLWFGEWGTGKIGMFDPATKQFTKYDLPFPSSPYGVYTDSKGYVWLAPMPETASFDSILRKRRSWSIPCHSDQLFEIFGPTRKDECGSYQGGFVTRSVARNTFRASSINDVKKFPRGPSFTVLVTLPSWHPRRTGWRFLG